IEIVFDVEDIDIGLNYSVLMGLIFHELLVNSLKYAFVVKNENPKIELFIKKEGKKILFGVKDNGVGFKKENIDKASSLGHKLIDSIVTLQLEGKIEEMSENGYTCIISFFAKDANEQS
ncbi:MAG: ATP-binding protein, partial [Campylobacteraceae bacterium]